jgi:DDE_Tnp_1-associated
MLDEMLLLCLVGVLAGCERWVELARFGEKKLSLLRRFRLFHGGTSSEGQLRDIFGAIDPEQFQRLFRSCFSSLTGFSTNKIREGGAKGLIPTVAASSSPQKLVFVLAQTKFNSANEITTLRQLLKLFGDQADDCDIVATAIAILRN